MFAEVAIPLYVLQTFTYALPESFAPQAAPGCRVLVPLGKQLITGYIVDVHTSLAEAGIDAATTEDVRRFQLHPAKQQIGAPTLNSAVAALSSI